MTNVLATNAVVPKSIDTPRYLRASASGFPISGQIPRTYQVYSGTGNETIAYDGSNEIRIFGPTLSGPLIITFGPARNMRNWVGRTVTLNIVGPITETVTLSSNPAFLMINGTELQQLSHVIAADNISKSITLYFSSEKYVNLDYGAAAAANAVPSYLPEIISVNSLYVYGQDSIFSLPAVYIPDSKTYDVSFNAAEPVYEGEIVVYSTTVTGPGTQNLTFGFIPAPRRTAPTVVTGWLSRAGRYFGSFSLKVSPILTNVTDVPHVMGLRSNGTLALFNPEVDAGVLQTAYDSGGVQINLGASISAIATDIADAIIFYVRPTSNTTIRWYSLSTGLGGTLADLALFSVSFWDVGATIADMTFNEVDRCLYVLSSVANGRVPRISIQPYSLQDPMTVKMGNTIANFVNLGLGSTPHCIASCPITGQLIISYLASAGTLRVAALQQYNPVAFGVTLITSSTTGKISVAFTANGLLCLQYEDTKELYTQINGVPFGPSAFQLQYVMPEFYPSLSRNCYGLNPV